MRSRLIRWMGTLFLFGAISAGRAAAQDIQLVEEREIIVSCRLPPEASWKSIPMLQKDRVKPTDQDYSYRLWLPKGYLADTEKRWPCIFIASPGGNARMGPMKDWIVKNGYIAVMLIESKNGPWAPIAGNFLAAHDDVAQRVRIQEGMKWATGFSGGARSASSFVQMRPGFSGLILQGAGPSYDAQGRYVVDGIRSSPWMAVAMTMGKDDMNVKEATRTPPDLAKDQCRVFSFDGGHVWAPKPVFEEAADWVLRRVLVEGPPNPALQPVYAGQFRQLAQSAQSATDPWTQFKLIGEAAEFAKSRKLDATPEGRELLPKMNSEANRLRSNPAVSRQLQASDALARFEQSRARLPPLMQREQLKSFINQYAGTDAVAKAEQLLAEVPESTPGHTPRTRR